MPKNEVPEDKKAREVKCDNLNLIRDAVWPESPAEDAYAAFDEFLSEREAYRLRKPDFFAPDLYDADAEEPYLVAGLLPEVGISLFVGDWDAGKTILLVDLAAHVAYGSPASVSCSWPCPRQSDSLLLSI